MKILQIVESAYRATLEEQDDTVLWLSHAMKNAGADITILLRGNAVNYALGEQNASLHASSLGIEHPPAFAEDLRKMQAKGVQVFCWKSDLEKRGISDEALIPDIRQIAGEDFARLADSQDYVLHW